MTNSLHPGGEELSPNPERYGFTLPDEVMAYNTAYGKGMGQFIEAMANSLAKVIAENDELKESRQHLEKRAHIDYLTGLRNRWGFVDEYERLISSVPYESFRNSDRGIPQPLRHCILFIDLDEFKEVNDTHGHAAGDAVLVEVAEVFRKGFRNRDVIARWGGDEFAGILASTPIEEAKVIAERLISNLNEIDVGASIGIAVVTRETSCNEAKDEADRAMYFAKAEGKNRVAGSIRGELKLL